MVTAFEYGEQRWQVNGGEEGAYSDEIMANGGSRGIVVFVCITEIDLVS